MAKKSLCGLTVSEIFSLIEPYGFTLSHATLISNSVYKKRVFEILRIERVPKRLLEILNHETVPGTFPPVASEVSTDKTIKYLFRSGTGIEYETVYIPDNRRNTVCVSTQSGCRMGCPFCVTARYGFHGNLSAGEIVNQVIGIPAAEKVTHVVFMGMGEPLDNLLNVIKACSILTSEWGLSLSPRNITVSSVGITPAIKEFLLNSDCNLTVSLHSPFKDERKLIVPVEKQYPIDEILEIMKSFPLRKKRRLSFAYLMISGLNDTDIHLQELIKLLAGTRIRVNLLPFHHIGNGKETSSSSERMQFFKHNLVVSGISASVRKSRGADISAACGLLASGLK